MKTYLKIADLATMLSVVSGILALVFFLERRVMAAALLLVFAVVFDFLDGRIARFMGQDSTFGVYLDSLADIVVFGMVPSAMLLFLERSPVTIIASVCFVCAGIYRLARFQITYSQPDAKKGYQGMPITLNGLFIPSLLSLAGPSVIGLVIYFFAASVAMVSTFRVKKL